MTSRAESTEHAVIVHISSSTDTDIGLDMIEDPLIDAIEATDVGEFDGNEIGSDEAVLFMYGPDADELWTVVEPVLRDANLGPGRMRSCATGRLERMNLRSTSASADLVGVPAFRVARRTGGVRSVRAIGAG
jgi:hypothetical protein